MAAVKTVLINVLQPLQDIYGGPVKSGARRGPHAQLQDFAAEALLKDFQDESASRACKLQRYDLAKRISNTVGGMVPLTVQERKQILDRIYRLYPTLIYAQCDRMINGIG